MNFQDTVAENESRKSYPAPIFMKMFTKYQINKRTPNDFEVTSFLVKNWSWVLKFMVKFISSKTHKFK